jgi:hypothetical protein
VTDSHKKLAAAALVVIAATWWLATDPSSPIRPTPPRPERPVLRFLAKAAGVAARLGLTAMWFMEPAPKVHASDDMKMAPRAEHGADGFPALRNEVW